MVQPPDAGDGVAVKVSREELGLDESCRAETARNSVAKAMIVDEVMANRCGYGNRSE